MNLSVPSVQLPVQDGVLLLKSEGAALVLLTQGA